MDIDVGAECVQHSAATHRSTSAPDAFVATAFVGAPPLFLARIERRGGIGHGTEAVVLGALDLVWGPPPLYF